MAKTGMDRLLKRLKAEQVKLEITRDELRVIVSDAEELISDTSDAADGLATAIDALSRLQ